uniref:Uncharacterized protein n=1 Tax=Poecilia mexicana TaxID=48701 RepID=A0A3B3WSC8_9TELE
MLSMGWPFSSLFSISTSSLTPSTTIWTRSTSEKPSRSALEMSNTPPTAAVSTPPERGQEQCPVSGASVWSESLQTWRACSCLAASHALLRADRCPGWRGRSERNPGVRST